MTQGRMMEVNPPPIYIERGGGGLSFHWTEQVHLDYNGLATRAAAALLHAVDHCEPLRSLWLHGNEAIPVATAAAVERRIEEKQAIQRAASKAAVSLPCIPVPPRRALELTAPHRAAHRMPQRSGPVSSRGDGMRPALWESYTCRPRLVWSSWALWAARLAFWTN